MGLLIKWSMSLLYSQWHYIVSPVWSHCTHIILLVLWIIICCYVQINFKLLLFYKIFLVYQAVLNYALRGPSYTHIECPYVKLGPAQWMWHGEMTIAVNKTSDTHMCDIHLWSLICRYSALLVCYVIKADPDHKVVKKDDFAQHMALLRSSLMWRKDLRWSMSH